MEAGIPRRPSADSPGPSPVPSAGRFAPSDSPPTLVGSPCSLAEDESTPATVAELWSLLQRQKRARRDHEKNQARLTAYVLLRPPPSSDAAFRRDLPSVDSSSKMVEILQADAPEPPYSTKELAELPVRDAQLTRENNALTRQMETAVTEATRLFHELAVVVRERDKWKKEVQRHTELITSFRKPVAAVAAEPMSSSRSVKSSQSGAKSNKSAGTKTSVPPRTTGKRMAAQNARVLQALEIQVLEASDDAVLGNADGGPSTSADNPVVVGSSSASSEYDQAEESASSASHSAASSADADSDSESGDSADRSSQHLKDAKALEALRTWSTKMKDASADDDNDEEEGEELEDKPAPLAGVDNSASATPAASPSSRRGTNRARQSSPQSSSKKARKTSTAAKSKSSSVKPTASKSTSSKSAVRKSAPSKSTTHKPKPFKSATAKSAESGSASSGQSAGNSGGSDLPDVLTLPIVTLRTRASQAVARLNPGGTGARGGLGVHDDNDEFVLL
ncbi:hypothetical protein PF004_g21857 [Phytophthora fragariae]|uniref:Uncharacterized protein n=3 Tax=Phytophthora fragariae TaxID=53985 RepID=A0A6G0N203_9STRA|nr:hypothetical protein PF004_g21857 [Phytophthora fragariae]